MYYSRFLWEFNRIDRFLIEYQESRQKYGRSIRIFGEKVTLRENCSVYMRDLCLNVIQRRKKQICIRRFVCQKQLTCYSEIMNIFKCKDFFQLSHLFGTRMFDLCCCVTPAKWSGLLRYLLKLFLCMSGLKFSTIQSFYPKFCSLKRHVPCKNSMDN